MKKNFGVFLAAIFFLGIFGMQQVSALSDLAYLIDVNSTSFLPSSIHPGDIVSMAVTVRNKGFAYPITDLNGTVVLGPQFEAINASYVVPQIGVGSSQTLIFKFRVKEDTLAGYYSAFLNFDYLRDGEKTNENRTIAIPVSASGRNIDVTISPKVINPGNQTEIVFTLNNISGTDVSNVSLSWTESSNLILPVGSDNKRYVSFIAAGQKEEVSYNAAADPNITTGIYALDVNLTYSDNSGIRTQSSKVGIIAGGATDFELSAELSSGQLSISVANIGSNNASATVVKIPQQPNITVSGSNIAILGALNKGDYTIASFTVQTTQSDRNLARQGEQATSQRQQATGQQSGTAQQGGFAVGDRNAFSGGQFANSIIVEIDYTDTTGERQVSKKTVQLASSGASGISSLGNFSSRQQASQFSYVPWILLAVIAGVAAYYNHSRAKKEWKPLLAVLAVTAILFLAVIFLLNSDFLASGIAAVVSITLLVLFFRTGAIDSIAARFLGKGKKSVQ